MIDPTQILINNLEECQNELSKYSPFGVGAPNIAEQQAAFMERYQKVSQEMDEDYNRFRSEFNKQKAIMDQEMAEFNTNFKKCWNMAKSRFGF